MIDFLQKVGELSADSETQSQMNVEPASKNSTCAGFENSKV